MISCGALRSLQPQWHFAALCGLVITGCNSAHSSGEQHKAEHEHAAHVIPAHKPRTFPDAVSRLRELTAHLTDPKDLAVALDIAGWLPEIAADSDMPEADWNNVSMQSSRLTGALARIQPGPVDKIHASVLDEANTAVSDLEKLLASAKPQWFENRIASIDSK